MGAFGGWILMEVHVKAGWFVVLAMGAVVSGCNATPDAAAVPENGVSLRNLADTDVAGEAGRGHLPGGELMATPSDPASEYYLLYQRRTPTGTVVAVIRQERGDRVAYARTEADCSRRLFHVLGVGDTRGEAEALIAHDGPLGPVAGLPLREEMATAVCGRAGMPLTAA